MVSARPLLRVPFAALLAVLFLASPLPPALARSERDDGALLFPETGFAITEPAFAEYFQRRGGVATFGYPVSRRFRLLGFTVQIFQRQVMQLQPDGSVRLLNLLDDGLMPYTSLYGSVAPAPAGELAQRAPGDGDEYDLAVLRFTAEYVPDEWQGMQVSFLRTFSSTVSLEDAFPEGGGDSSLLPLLNLEIWGLPTSAPAIDPRNHNFVYLRFQRGIMHYDATTGLTQGLLLADYFKAILTGEDLPADLAQQAGRSRFLRQYAPGQPRSLARPEDLPGSDLTDAFTPDAQLLAVPGDLTPALLLVAEWDRERGGELIATLQRHRVRIEWGAVPSTIRAAYNARLNRIVLARSLSNEHVHVQAAVLAHEAQHAYQRFTRGRRIDTEECLLREREAFEVGSALWERFYGPNGKPDPGTEAERELNMVQRALRQMPDRFTAALRDAYREECTGFAAASGQ